MNKFLIGLVVLFLSQLTFASEGVEPEWKLITEEDGVKVFKRDFPGWEVDLSFETPNYKVQVGRFKDYYFGLNKLK